LAIAGVVDQEQNQPRFRALRPGASHDMAVAKPEILSNQSGIWYLGEWVANPKSEIRNIRRRLGIN
jgi:hypothetical protein